MHAPPVLHLPISLFTCQRRQRKLRAPHQWGQAPQSYTVLTAKFHLLNVPWKRGSLAWGSKEIWSKTRAGDGQACTSHFHFAPCSCRNVISSKPLHTGAKNCIKTLQLLIKSDSLLVKGSIFRKTDIIRQPTIKDFDSAPTGMDQKNSTPQTLAALSNYCATIALISPARQYFFNKSHLPEACLEMSIFNFPVVSPEGKKQFSN